MGGCYIIDTPQILHIQDTPILWLTKSSEQHDLVNIDLRGQAGDQLFSMRDNDWLVFPPVDDIIAPPRPRSLVIKSKLRSVSLDMDFTAKQPELIYEMIVERTVGNSLHQEALDVLRNQRKQLLKAGGYFLKGETLMCRIACDIAWPERVTVKHDGVSYGSNNLVGSISLKNSIGIAIRCTKNAGAGFAFG